MTTRQSRAMRGVPLLRHPWFPSRSSLLDSSLNRSHSRPLPQHPTRVAVWLVPKLQLPLTSSPPSTTIAVPTTTTTAVASVVPALDPLYKLALNRVLVPVARQRNPRSLLLLRTLLQLVPIKKKKVVCCDGYLHRFEVDLHRKIILRCQRLMKRQRLTQRIHCRLQRATVLHLRRYLVR